MWGDGLGSSSSAQGSVATLVNIVDLRVAYKASLAELLSVSRDGLCHIILYMYIYIYNNNTLLCLLHTKFPLKNLMSIDYTKGLQTTARDVILSGPRKNRSSLT
jgi:hypothetical protein